MSDKFWMCWVSGTEGTHKRYEVRVDAMVEAQRLARREHKPVYLLESIDCVRVAYSPLVWDTDEKEPLRAGGSGWDDSTIVTPTKEDSALIGE